MSQRGRAAGAVAAQFSQALASFSITLLGLRSLDPSAFGVLSILLGGLVVATALMTGVVGDSLTVLDRSSASVRAGLQVWTASLTAAMLVVGLLLARSVGSLSWIDAALYGGAVSVFALEDTARRLLMANFRFWSVVGIDLVYLGAAAGWLAGAGLVSGGLGLRDFLVAVLVGQAVAILIALGLLPAADRYLADWRGADVRVVLAFGGSRALQQILRPASLTLVRGVVAGSLGSATLGGLEAARVYTSPALLLVQGTGGFLLATYARERGREAAEALRAADRAAGTLIAASVGLGGLAVLVLPLLGGVLSRGGTHVHVPGVLAWSLYAAAVAATMPYASLAAVRGRQGRVLGLRVADTVVGLTVAVIAVRTSHAAAAAPIGLASGSLLGAVLQRRVARGSGAREAGSDPVDAPHQPPVHRTTRTGEQR